MTPIQGTEQRTNSGSHDDDSNQINVQDNNSLYDKNLSATDRIMQKK
jgi:hypothetical protein